MNPKKKSRTSPEECFLLMKEKMQSKDVKVAMITFLFGLCLYIPTITMRLPCSDGTLCGLLYRSHMDYDLEDMMGRFLLKWLAHLKSMFIFSWLAVIVSIICMVLGAVLICKVLRIEDTVKMLVVCLFVQVSPCFIETFTYYYATDAYVLCFLLVTLAVYLLHEKKSICRAISAIFLMFLSMTFYQAYIFVAVVLFMFVFMRDLLDEKKEWKEIRQGLYWHMGSGMIAFVVYVLCEKVFRMTGLIFYQEARFDFAEIFKPKMLLGSIVNAYRDFFGYFFTMDFLNNMWKARYLMNAFVLLLSIGLLVFLMVKKHRKWTYNLAIIIAVVLLPMAFMGISILNWQEGATRLMMLPAVSLFYIWGWALWTQTIREYKDNSLSICGWALYAVSAYLLVIMTVYIGIYQVCTQYYADKTDSMAQRIITRIEQEYPETAAESPVFICGNVDEGNYPQDYWIAQASYIMIGTQACQGMFANTMQGYFGGWNAYMRANFGVEYGMVWGEAPNIYASDFYKEMPLFPAEGSVKKNEDGVVVVKLKN